MLNGLLGATVAVARQWSTEWITGNARADTRTSDYSMTPGRLAYVFGMTYAGSRAARRFDTETLLWTRAHEPAGGT